MQENCRNRETLRTLSSAVLDPVKGKTTQSSRPVKGKLSRFMYSGLRSASNDSNGLGCSRPVKGKQRG